MLLLDELPYGRNEAVGVDPELEGVVPGEHELRVDVFVVGDVRDTGRSLRGQPSRIRGSEFVANGFQFFDSGVRDDFGQLVSSIFVR